MSFNKTMNLAFKTPLYCELYRAKGINRSSINDESDLHKLPTISKEDLINDYLKAVAEPSKVIKYHTTSGTSGNPTIVAFTNNDWRVYVKQNINCLKLIGVKSQDVVYNSTPYGMFFAGLVLHDASIQLGAKVVPAGTLSSAQAHINLIKTFKPSVFIGVPQYLLKLGKSLTNNDSDPKELSIKRAYCLGEPLPDNKRDLIEDLWDLTVFRGYGLSECGAGAECAERVGFHWPVSDVLVEVLDEHHGKGELTYTTINKTGTLAIRFRSRDLGSIINEPCACGEKAPLISHIEERLDDLVKIKGTLISPFTIDKAVYSVSGVSNYLFIVDESDYLDVVRVYVEGEAVNPIMVSNAIKSNTFIKPSIVKVVSKDSIPLIGRKGKRFIDLRKKKSFNQSVRKFEKQVQ